MTYALVSLCLIFQVAATPFDPHRSSIFEQERWSRSRTSPAFRVELFSDGLLQFYGRVCVANLGRHQRYVSPEDMKTVKRLFRTAKFRQLKEDCCNCQSSADNTTIATILGDASAMKRIEHRVGCRTAPASLVRLEEELFRVLKLSSWVDGGPGDRRQECGPAPIVEGF